MPVYTSPEALKANKLPWVDIDDYEFIYLGRTGMTQSHNTQQAQQAGHTAVWGTAQVKRDPTEITLKPTSPKERIVVLVGEAHVETAYGRVTLRRRDWLDIPPSGATIRNISASTVELVRIAGNWQQAIRTEIFQFRPEKPCDYHFHDGDEYWFVFRGNFTLNYDDREYPMGPGMMLAAGMGYEHGSLNPEQHFEGVGFATQLEGQGRDGHLLRELHGAPVKNRDVPESAMYVS
jgi:mannose-6-phosphate isomerase-like protein (cupin superfamily)